MITTKQLTEPIGKKAAYHLWWGGLRNHVCLEGKIVDTRPNFFRTDVLYRLEGDGFSIWVPSDRTYGR